MMTFLIKTLAYLTAGYTVRVIHTLSRGLWKNEFLALFSICEYFRVNKLLFLLPKVRLWQTKHVTIKFYWVLNEVGWCKYNLSCVELPPFEQIISTLSAFIVALNVDEDGQMCFANI